jgi:hypothetical protein
VLKGKYLALKANSRKEELMIKKLEKAVQIKPKKSRWKERIRINGEIKEIDNKNNRTKSLKLKAGFHKI